MRKLFFILLLAICTGMTGTAWAKSRSGIVTLEFDLSRHDPSQELKLWVPYPISDRDQLISDVKLGGDSYDSGVYTDRIYQTPILYAAWPKNVKSRKLTLSFAVERQEISRRDLPQNDVAWNRADYAEYLKPTSLGPIDGEVQKLALQITKDKKTLLAKSRAIYDWTCENTFRDPNTRGCGTGDVCKLLQRPGGKCTDISSVFIALARAAGIPAREIFSVRLGRKAEEDVTGYQHCWAEFFLPGYGWVPADPADVRKAMLVEKLELKDAKTSEYREYFWGGIDPYRVVIATGRDVVLNPPQAGPPLNTFGYPYAELGGKALDWLDSKGFGYRIMFREK